MMTVTSFGENGLIDTKINFNTYLTMKNQILTLLLITLGIVAPSFLSIAQETVEISGQVKDDQTKENLAYCKVVALNEADSLIGGGITDEDGFYRLPLQPGQYKFVISSFGYENDTLQTGLFQEDKFLGVARLKAKVLDMENVSVSASSRVDLLEKDVQIITEEQKVGATAAKDVLDRISGISYDEYSGVLKVDGSANIMVLVNGVEKSQEYIQNLDPERLIRVEIIRDPGGRYGLEGYTAIVNVILKRDYRGSELYIEQMQLVDVAPEYNRLDYMIGNLLATYNYTKNDLNIYGSAAIGRKEFKITTESTTEYADGTLIEENAISKDPNTLILQKYADYTLGFDYRINPKHLISFESNIQALPLSSSEENIRYQTSVYSNDTLVENYDFFSDNSDRSSDILNSLFYIAEFSERSKLTVNFSHSIFSQEYHSVSAQEGYYDRDEVGINKKQYTRGYAELDQVLSKKTSIQVGYGNTWRELKNTFSFTTTDAASGVETDFSSDFRLTDMRHKLYSNLSLKMGKKWSTRIGIAAESSAPRVGEQQLNYLIFQPLFDLRYVLNPKVNFMFKYRTEGEYPTIDQTNPFVSLVNPRITSRGNPFLKPSTNHQFSLRTNLFQGMLAIEPYSHYSNNMVVNVGELDSNNMFNFRYENASLFVRNGATVNFSKFFDIGIIVQANLEAYHTKIVSTSKTNSLFDWRGDIDLIYMFMKSETLLGLKYQRQLSKNISGLGYDKGDVDFWLLFYKRPLFKKRASVMFGYFLPLNLATNYTQGFRAETVGITMQTNNDVSLVKNMFILEFSFRLSKGKSIKTTEKDILKDGEEGGGGIF